MILPVEVNLTYTTPFLTESDLYAYLPLLEISHDHLQKGTGIGCEWLGWQDLPLTIVSLLPELNKVAYQIRSQSQVLLVVGIGGSYLGARAALEYLTSPYYNLLAQSENGMQIFFVGRDLSASELQRVMSLIADRDFAVCVVSKSGTTAESMVTFNILKARLERTYGQDEAKKRIYAITDANKGILRELVQQEAYTSFAIPSDVGGRYSMLTAAGLLPLAVAGIDLEQLVEGALYARKLVQNRNLTDNPAWQYVAARHALAAKGYVIELFGSYEPEAKMLSEWWKQLFGESEGKEGKGIFPASLELTTDLHSLGQYIQDGPRHLFCTILEFATPSLLTITREIKGSSPEERAALSEISELNELVRLAALKAHNQGGSPSICLRTAGRTPYDLGMLVYFLEYACALSSYVWGVNPFDQPGVEAYKAELKVLRQVAQKGS